MNQALLSRLCTSSLMPSALLVPSTQKRSLAAVISHLIRQMRLRAITSHSWKKYLHPLLTTKKSTIPTSFHQLFLTLKMFLPSFQNNSSARLRQLKWLFQKDLTSTLSCCHSYKSVQSQLTMQLSIGQRAKCWPLVHFSKKVAQFVWQDKIHVAAHSPIATQSS